MTDIVLAVPIGAASFQRATETVSEEVAARVREWPAVTVIVDGVAYIPLRTDWMPPGDRRTADGVEILIGARWPDEAQLSIDAGIAPRISGTLMGRLWEMMCDADTEDEQSEAPAVAPERVASGDVQMGAGPALHIGAGEEGGVLPGEDASCCGDLSALQDMDQQVSCPTPSADQVAPAESGITDEVIESVFPLDQIAKMGAAMALKMLEDYREKHPHLGILETPDLVLMGHDDLTALLTRAVTDPQVVAEARGRKAKLDEMLAAQQREARRPKIIMNDKVLNEKTSEAIDALQVMNEPPRLFVRAGRLVRVEHDEHNRPVIQTLNKAAVRGELDRAAHWVVYKPDKDKEMVESYVTPGEAIAEDLMERPSSEWGLPPLIGIATSPILHLDGSIHDAAGYDPLTRMYLLPEPGFVLAPVPASPTSEDIEAAKALLLEPFWDFPFVDEASRWNAVGALMTGVFRPIIEGPCPCWLLTKPQAGSGASLMQCAVYSAITGSVPPASVTPKTKEEWEKRALSILMGGAPVHIWDNLEGSFRSDVLASLLTAREWRGRRLGQTEEVSVPARTVWFANGNNVQIGGDLARRVYLSRIDAEVALPWMREDFRHPDLLTWVRENRGRLI
uniref:hypothetical protein n=1 Tax=Methanoculleus sp. UBA312 TaxID=1915499 RepID=UPI0031BA5BBF